MQNNAHNSLISTSPTNCTDNRRESFLFVFNSIASLCHKLAAGRDGFVIINQIIFNMIRKVFLRIIAATVLIGTAQTAQAQTTQNIIANELSASKKQDNSSIIGRPYKYYDRTAFCAYNRFHPSQYLTDNNWDILCAFVEPGPAIKLDSFGITYNKSQLRLLEVGDLLSFDKGIYSTSMPIFSRHETEVIRKQSKEFADSIFPAIEPEISRLITDIEKLGYSKQTYSLIFSYLLDTYIWDNERLASPTDCEDHGSWSGAYWAMFDPRNHVKVGTNGYGPVKQNWTDSLGYWLNSTKLMSFAEEVIKSGGNRIENQDIIKAIAGWGLVDENGDILIPIMHRNSNDDIDILCKSITNKLSNAIKNYCRTWYSAYNLSSERVGQIIFYHEVMWDLLETLELKELISMPPILKGEKVGKQHFGDICFIVIENADE